MNQTDAIIVYSIKEKTAAVSTTNLVLNSEINLEIFNPAAEEFTGIKLNNPDLGQNEGASQPIFAYKQE